MYLRKLNSTLIIITLLITAINGYSSGISNAGRHLSKRMEESRDQPLLLIKDGKSRSTIVIPEEATSREKALALDLQRLLHKMSGCMLEIKMESADLNDNLIQIGKTRYNMNTLNLEGVKPEGFWIKTVGSNLLLSGNDDSGTEFAVYTFLERYCGMGWFWPGESGELVPKKKTLVVEAVQVLEEPDFYLRKIMAKPRISMPSGDFRQAEKNAQSPAPIETQLWQKRNRLGGSVDYAGIHTWGKMVPPEEYGPTHPEYFALYEGKRRWENFNGKHHCQLCTTNPEVIKLGIQWAREFLDENPGIKYVTIAPNDGGQFCECDNCRAIDREAGSPEGVISDRIFTFANHIAEGVKETNPDKGVLMLAYSRYLNPPLKVKLADNICVQLCITSDRFCDGRTKREAYDLLSRWSDATNNLANYDYYVWRGSADLPRGLTPLIEESIRQFYKAGSRLFYTQSHDNFGSYALNYYVASRILWNINLNAEDCMEEFCQKCFGKAAEPMQKWFKMLDDQWLYAVKKEGPDLYGGSPAYWLAMFEPGLLVKARDYFEEAKSLVKETDTRQRIEFFEKELKYTELTINALYLLKELEQTGIIDLDDQYPTRFENDGSYVEIDLASKASKKTGGKKGQSKQKAYTQAEIRNLIKKTVEAWEARNAYIEELRGMHIIDYWHVKEDADRDYRHDPTPKLKKLLERF
ncbi:DUF4838 domain-containing protein [Mariniphaga sediminis]|uniref:DUF4838 domain-containing protein n=1 Tax=Mariniphaga sediminis TaxID=1628158 RepID=UPI003564959F